MKTRDEFIAEMERCEWSYKKLAGELFDAQSKLQEYQLSLDKARKHLELERALVQNMEETNNSLSSRLDLSRDVVQQQGAELLATSRENVDLWKRVTEAESRLDERTMRLGECLNTLRHIAGMPVDKGDRELYAAVHGVTDAARFCLTNSRWVEDLDAEKELTGIAAPCEHAWIDATNEVISGMDYCGKCGLVRSHSDRIVEKPVRNSDG